MKKDIVPTVLAKRTENNGGFIPSTLTVNQPVYFAIDNVDLAIDTPDGKKTTSWNWYISTSTKISWSKGTYLSLILMNFRVRLKNVFRKSFHFPLGRSVFVHTMYAKKTHPS